MCPLKKALSHYSCYACKWVDPPSQQPGTGTSHFHQEMSVSLQLLAICKIHTCQPIQFTGTKYPPPPQLFWGGYDHTAKCKT